MPPHALSEAERARIIEVANEPRFADTMSWHLYGMLFGKKAGKKIAVGQTVTLQVRNSDGSLSNQLSFRRP